MAGTAVTTRLSVIAQALKDKLVDSQADLGLQDVWYGDQAKVPRTPAVAVEPEGKSREIVGAASPAYSEVRPRISIIIYHARLQDIQITRKECDEVAEAVELLIHRDTQLGGLVIFGYITTVESGYTFRSNTLFRTTRMTYEALVRKQLPN